MMDCTSFQYLSSDDWQETRSASRRTKGIRCSRPAAGAPAQAAFEEFFSTEGLFIKQFMTETGKEGWRPVLGADPAKLDPWVKVLGQARNFVPKFIATDPVPERITDCLIEYTVDD